MRDEQLMRQVIEESKAMQADAFELPIVLDGPSALALIGSLQLSLRHPGNTGTNAQITRGIIDALKAIFWDAGYSACTELIDRGYDPQHDQPKGASA